MSDQVSRARSVPIEAELSRRGINLRGRGAERSGPCPRCFGVDRFNYNARKNVFFCRQSGAKGDTIALVQYLDGASFHEAVATLTSEGRPRVPIEPAPVNRPSDDYLRVAIRFWESANLLPDSAIAYFASRNIDITAVPDNGGLRFHPHCMYDDSVAPCVLGRYTDAITGEPRGIWRRPIDGRKPKSLGPMAGCVIRLWPDDAVEQGLILGEGVETTLAAATRITHRGTLLQPAWAAASAGNMAKFPVLPGIEALTLLADNDSSSTGQNAALECSGRWTEAGREVVRLTPRVLGADFNDVVIQGGSK